MITYAAASNTYPTLLSVFKYLGFVVAAISTIWALIKKTTVDDSTGQKRLTAAGHIALILTLFSALVSVFSYGLEQLMKRQEHENAERKEEDATQLHIRERAQDAERVQWLNEQAKLRDELDRQREQLNRFEQTQQLILASQPLRTFSFSMRFHNLSKEQQSVISSGMKAVGDVTDADSGDVGDLGGDALRKYVQEASRSYVLYPFLQTIADEPSGYGMDHTPSDNFILLVDMDGSASVLLPIGGTTEPKFQGYVEDVHMLRKRVTGSAAYYDGPPFNRGTCPSLAVRVPKAMSYIEISGNVSSDCMSDLLQFKSSGFATAALPHSLRVIVVNGGKYGLPFSPDNVLSTTFNIDLCWEDVIPDSSRKNLELTVSITPNSQPAATRTYHLRQSRVSHLEYRTTYQDDALDYGTCAAFGTKSPNR